MVSGEGLEESLVGVGCIVDVASGPSPDREAATAFFTAAPATCTGSASAPARG